MRFRDRRDAGRRLADHLLEHPTEDPVVLALPRGGVPVAFEVARRLHAPLDVLVARKIGAPSQPELGLGAIAEGGEPYLDERMLVAVGVTHEDLAPTIAAEREELQRRVARYRGERPPLPVAGRTAVVVDDGLATGGTARAAIRALRDRNPARILLAVPVCAPATAEALTGDADEVVSVLTPRDFLAVGYWYDDFTQTPDEEVVELLGQAARELRIGG